jgi:hypothetical protein
MIADTPFEMWHSEVFGDDSNESKFVLDEN